MVQRGKKKNSTESTRLVDSRVDSVDSSRLESTRVDGRLSSNSNYVSTVELALDCRNIIPLGARPRRAVHLLNAFAFLNVGTFLPSYWTTRNS